MTEAFTATLAANPYVLSLIHIYNIAERVALLHELRKGRAGGVQQDLRNAANGIATAESGTYLKSMLNELGDTGR